MVALWPHRGAGAGPVNGRDLHSKETESRILEKVRKCCPYSTDDTHKKFM